MMLPARDFTNSDAEYNAWRRTLTQTHERRIVVRVTDLEHRRITTIDNVLDGQITIDVANRECTRVANLTLLDPTRSIGWEPDTPSALPLHLHRMVTIIDYRRVQGADWVGCAVFTGPVVEIDRNGAEVALVCHGKERLALGSFGRTHQWPKGRRVTAVIRDILELAGENSNRIHLPTSKATLAHPLTVTRTDKPWVEARKLAGSRDFHLFYDGRGHVRMRRQTKNPVFTFDSNWLLGPMRLDRPKQAFRNGWIINGPKPAAKKPRVSSGLIALPKNNPFSAYSLRRGGRWHWRIHEEERKHVKTVKDAKAIADRMRDQRIRFAADVSFDALPLPILEEWDRVKVIDPLAGRAVLDVRQATIPLLEGGMTIGSIKRISRMKRR